MRIVRRLVALTILAGSASGCGSAGPTAPASANAPAAAEGTEATQAPSASSSTPERGSAGQRALGSASASSSDTLPGAGTSDADVGKAVATLLKEIEAEKRWRGELTTPTPEFLELVRAKLRAWGHALAILSAKGHHERADRVAKAIVELRNHWGPTLLPMERLSSFPRDTFEVGPLRVLVVQFFEPVPYYPGSDRIMKLYQFLVYEQDQPVADYCLEHSNLAGDYYVLGRMDAKSHAQIQPYGSRPPPYATLRQRVIEDLRGIGQRQGPSMQKGP